MARRCHSPAYSVRVCPPWPSGQDGTLPCPRTTWLPARSGPGDVHLVEWAIDAGRHNFSPQYSIFSFSTMPAPPVFTIDEIDMSLTRRWGALVRAQRCRSSGVLGTHFSCRLQISTLCGPRSGKSPIESLVACRCMYVVPLLVRLWLSGGVTDSQNLVCRDIW